MKKTHNEQVRDMLMTRPYVKISELRGWCNYRSRISDVRKKYNMRIEPIKVSGPDGKRNIHAFAYIAPMPEEKIVLDKQTVVM